MYIYRYTYTYIVPICITYTYIVPICIVPSCILTHLYANPTHIVLLLYLAPDFPIYSRFTQPNIIFKLRILFQNSSTIFTFRRQWTKVTYHLLSTIWPFIPHKPYIFWKLMTRPSQITSSSVIHQLPISSSLVVTNNDDIVQNLIQFLVQNSHSLLLSSFTNNYIVGSWTFNPPKCKPPFLSSICVSTLLAPFLSGQ